MDFKGLECLLRDCKALVAISVDDELWYACHQFLSNSEYWSQRSRQNGNIYSINKMSMLQAWAHKIIEDKTELNIRW